MNAVPGVISKGDHIGPRVIDLLGLAGQNAYAGGVFAVHHRKMNAVEPLDGAQMLFQKRKPLFTHHVANGKKIEYHSSPSLSLSLPPIARTRPRT